jgi:hypothetical protein
MLVVRWTRLPYTLEGRTCGFSELARFSACYALPAWVVRRPRGFPARSSPGQPRRPTHASNSLSTPKLSLNLLPGSPPRARRASRSAIRALLVAEAARLEASNAGARRLLGYARNANATPRTNSTHATGSAGGRATEPCGTLETRPFRAYAAPWCRLNNATRGDTTRLETPLWTCTCTDAGTDTGAPPRPSRCSTCVPATRPISRRSLLLQGRRQGEKEARRDFHSRIYIDRYLEDSARGVDDSQCSGLPDRVTV